MLAFYEQLEKDELVAREAAAPSSADLPFEDSEVEVVDNENERPPSSLADIQGAVMNVQACDADSDAYSHPEDR